MVIKTIQGVSTSCWRERSTSFVSFRTTQGLGVRQSPPTSTIVLFLRLKLPPTSHRFFSFQLLSTMTTLSDRPKLREHKSDVLS
eukprot:752594-Hanusia_phi.AAC.5